MHMLIMHSSSFNMHVPILHSSSFSMLQLSKLACRACPVICLQPPHVVKCCMQQLYQMCMAAECMPLLACKSRFTTSEDVHTACTKPVCTAVTLHDSPPTVLRQVTQHQSVMKFSVTNCLFSFSHNTPHDV